MMRRTAALRGEGWLLLGVTLALAVHVPRLPYWLTAISTLLIAWRWYAPPPAAAARRRLPGLLRQGFALLLLLVLVAYYRTWLGPQVGLAMLALLSSFKLAEARSGRDVYLLFFMTLFLLLGNFLSDQSLPALLHALAVLWLMCMALLAHNDRAGSLGRAALFAESGRMLAAAVPLAILAFLFFPRFAGPLWGAVAASGTAVTGLGETMEPGSIINVIRSGEAVLRVEFHGTVPQRDQLYWRGPVLWYTDGRKWSPGQGSGATDRPAERPQVIPLGPALQYTIIQEATEQRRLFALELPDHTPPEMHLTSDMQLVAPRPLREKIRHQLGSHVYYQFLERDPEALLRALQLPPGRHPRSRELARQWRQEQPEPRAFVERVLHYFRSRDFVYTLSPEPLPGDSMDAFLFDTREGFCEHYAAAFTVLMRAGGIPARIVTGYQGGTFNPLGNYHVVRQSDAHAWAEIWLELQGWVRVDPVAAVAPERIRAGMDDVLPSLDPPARLQPLLAPLSAGQWGRSLRNLLDTAYYQWSKWVLGYDTRRQQQLLELLRLERFGTRALYGLLGAGLLVLLPLCFLALRAGGRTAPGRAEPAQRCYRRFCRRLAELGVKRRPYEGPLDFAARARRLVPGAATAIDAVTQAYIRVRYRGEHAALAELRRRVRAFRPARGTACAAPGR